MNLLPFFQWCEASGVGTAIRNSLWLFPIIEAIHLLAFAAIGGAILLVDLRLLGLAMRREPPAELSRDAQPWLLGALAVMLTTGTLLFLSESVKCYYSTPFRVKMMALFLAVIFTFTVRRKVAAAGNKVPFAGEIPFTGKLVALISIVLWGTVAWGGRWIGFSG
jgi:hypothetical protein